MTSWIQLIQEQNDFCDPDDELSRVINPILSADLGTDNRNELFADVLEMIQAARKDSYGYPSKKGKEVDSF